MTNTPRRVYSGFDSAWTGNNLGACASIIEEDGRLTLEGPFNVSFGEALTRLKKHNIPGTYHLLAIDQPLIVPNATGKRPVERAVSHLVGHCGGGVQPSNRGKANMFGSNAPIWSFLQNFGGDLDPARSPNQSQGIFVIEVFPAIGNLGLIDKYFTRRRMPKYNPDRRNTFSIDDWKDLCAEIGSLFSQLGIQAGSAWCARASSLTSPNKADQDNLDALICALHALRWATHGFSASAMVGDLVSGYMVIPCDKNMRQVLEQDSLGNGVPFRSNV